jgi:hypothetical protein
MAPKTDDKLKCACYLKIFVEVGAENNLQKATLKIQTKNTGSMKILNL